MTDFSAIILDALANNGIVALWLAYMVYIHETVFRKLQASHERLIDAIDALREELIRRGK
ncbi:hypothetical protein HY572_00930 [Candidatus Micrarchaeota archaeon]|nr:hypothetical protein [Candidatus Micrarchaeota archaeon]